MRITKEMPLHNFEFWGGARDTADQLTTREFNLVEEQLEELYPDGVDEYALNDLFRYEPEFIFELCGKTEDEEEEEDEENDEEDEEENDEE